jgi:hypothetical protein
MEQEQLPPLVGGGVRSARHAEHAVETAAEPMRSETEDHERRQPEDERLLTPRR